MPARECGAVLDDVVGGPPNAPRVHRAGDLVVRAEDVEVAGGQVLDEEVDDLVRRPRRGRFLDPARRHAGVRVARYEEVGGDGTAGPVSQVVGETLRIDL